MRKVLLFGCGSRTENIVGLPGETPGTWDGYEVTTLDVNPDHGTDMVFDLNTFPYPFADNSFDRVEGHQVLEHLGSLGDYRHLFREFEEWHRILKPGGYFVASVPMWNSLWAFGDPSHVRVINAGTLTFLDQESYKQVGKSPISDFRFCYKGNFSCVQTQEAGDNFFFILRAVK